MFPHHPQWSHHLRARTPLPPRTYDRHHSPMVVNPSNLTERISFMTSNTRRLPSVVEPLEPRQFLSATLAIGAIGDSYTDEYQFYAPDRSTAENYIEQLASNRN